ncbi:expressed protein [Arabidopsis lyrata subsp. lyrata]|uniref:Expressed protein n=1 Tax=Arabidopsis lyrata subsp. lyrata TaxID=81972 RepID=D7KRD3_ARALL|nr:expressed protein [Arabidopsis lyrata subsp. lyrata]
MEARFFFFSWNQENWVFYPSIYIYSLDPNWNSFFFDIKIRLYRSGKQKKMLSEFSLDTTCYFFHSFLSGSVVVLQTLPRIWTNPFLHTNV